MSMGLSLLLSMMPPAFASTVMTSMLSAPPGPNPESPMRALLA